MMTPMKFGELEIDLSAPAVRYENVSKDYGDGVLAVSDLNLTVEAGEFVMLVGSSGGGKTTILKMINGLVEPTQGTVFVHGHNIQDYDIISLRRHIGYSIQGNVLFPHMTIARNIAYVLSLEGEDRQDIKDRVTHLIDLVGLDTSLLRKYPHELSGGQQQRVGIARALAAQPRILLMDEPFGAVDSITRASLQDEISRIFEMTGISILFVTHDINEAVKLGTKIAVMDGGVLQQYATPDELLSTPATAYVEKLIEPAHS